MEASQSTVNSTKDIKLASWDPEAVREVTQVFAGNKGVRGSTR